MTQTPPPQQPVDDQVDVPVDDAVDPATAQETEETLLEKIVEYKNLALRATADYRNLQRESEQRLADMRKFATEDLLSELCPLIDYFDSAFIAIPEDQKKVGWVQGVHHIQDYLLNILRNHQVERMTTIGQPFNPTLHESVGAEVSDQPDHTILKEMQAGFMLNGKVIRPARVIISQGPQPASDQPPPPADDMATIPGPMQNSENKNEDQTKTNNPI